MNIEIYKKASFAVIGKQGSAKDGDGFIKKLWADANSRFEEVSQLAKRDENGNMVGIWGAMSDFSLSFAPWEEDFTKGLYLAGVECDTDAQAPANWVKWIIPGFEYIRTEVDAPDTFRKTLKYLADNGLTLAGAVQDFTCPSSGRSYMCFPVKRI